MIHLTSLNGFSPLAGPGILYEVRHYFLRGKSIRTRSFSNSTHSFDSNSHVHYSTLPSNVSKFTLQSQVSKHCKNFRVPCVSLVPFYLRRKIFRILELCFMEIKLTSIDSAHAPTLRAFFLTFRQKYFIQKCLRQHFVEIASQVALIWNVQHRFVPNSNTLWFPLKSCIFQMFCFSFKIVQFHSSYFLRLKLSNFENRQYPAKHRLLMMWNPVTFFYIPCDIFTEFKLLLSNFQLGCLLIWINLQHNK